MDRISKLPARILETILCLVPIQEAARTSILSREWRYHWTKIPKLEFNEYTFQVSTNEDELSVLEQTFDRPSERKAMTDRCKLFYAIYQVLLVHEGPIHEFSLSMRVDDSCVEIDHILRHLSKKNTVEILKLNFHGRYSYKLPLSFFSFHQLKDLYLNDCVLDHQPSSNVFGKLTTLYLQVEGNKKELQGLLSSCPSLKRLTIITIGGPLYHVRFGDFTIADLVECLPVIEYLSIYFISFMSFHPRPKELPTLVHLKCLCMKWVCLWHENVAAFLLLMLRSSPNLEKLKLVIQPGGFFVELMFCSFKLEDYSDIMLEHLNELEIRHLTGLKIELAIVKLILATSPALTKVRILFGDHITKMQKMRIFKTLSTLQCASSAVEFIVC